MGGGGGWYLELDFFFLREMGNELGIGGGVVWGGIGRRGRINLGL